MRNIVLELHQLFNEQRRFSFPFKEFKKEIPKNGIYIIFENGEKYNAFDRIVRVGTHTGNNQLLSRLNQHFVKENKNRSIFRKNIGRCFLNKEKPSYLLLWELDITSRVDKEKNINLLDLAFEKELEKKITEYVQSNLSFCVLPFDTKEERLFWESKIASTLAKVGEIKPSGNWLGNHSTKDKIKRSGLWQVNELYNEGLTEVEFDKLKSMFLEKIKLFEYGTEGSSTTVFKLADNTVMEKGKSGGILEEDEDPSKDWEKSFDTWEVWWQNFTDTNKEFWIRYHPIFIHDFIKAFIKNAVDKYNSTGSDVSRHTTKWNRLLVLN
jgi:hypothetical protein